MDSNSTAPSATETVTRSNLSKTAAYEVLVDATNVDSPDWHPDSTEDDTDGLRTTSCSFTSGNPSVEVSFAFVYPRE